VTPATAPLVVEPASRSAGKLHPVVWARAPGASRGALFLRTAISQVRRALRVEGLAHITKTMASSSRDALRLLAALRRQQSLRGRDVKPANTRAGPQRRTRRQLHSQEAAVRIVYAERH